MVTLCQHAWYVIICPLYKHVLLSLQWDEMGGLFTVYWYCYLNHQWPLGPFRPRKIGSTFEMGVWIQTHARTHSTHIRSFSHSHTHIRFVAFKNSDSFRELHSFQSFKICSWLNSHFTSPEGAKSDLLTFPTGSASFRWKDPFSDRGPIVSLNDFIWSSLVFF